MLPPPEKAPTITVYTLQFIDAERATEIVEMAAPQAEVKLDPGDSKRLSVWGKPTDHDTIVGVLKQVDVEEAAGSAYTAVIYSLEAMDAHGGWIASASSRRAGVTG